MTARMIIYAPLVYIYVSEIPGVEHETVIFEVPQDIIAASAQVKDTWAITQFAHSAINNYRDDLRKAAR